MAVETNARIEFSVASVEEWEKVNPKLHQGEPVFAKKPSGKYILKVGATGGSTYKNAVVVWDQDDAETKMTSTQEAASQALASKNAASASASAAKASETAAAGSKSAAVTSAANAKISETNASASKTDAANSASTAIAKATAAAKSASAAATSETNAAKSASAAATSESNALKSASAASNSAGKAKTSETNASASASAAKASETAAAGSKSAAVTSAANAKISETNAAASANTAKAWSMSDSSPDGVSGNKSAKTWAEEANTSASNSADSASASQSSATESASSATNAANSANASKQSASASANSASAAASSASSASTSETNAKTSETNAAKSATAAAQSAANAKLWDPTVYAKLSEVFPITDTGRKDVKHTITDLNDIKCISYPSWSCLDSAYVQAMSNCPTKTAFYLFNVRNGASSTSKDDTFTNLTSYYYYIVQLLLDIGGNMWVRTCFNSSKETFNFTSWVKVATKYDLPTQYVQSVTESNGKLTVTKGGGGSTIINLIDTFYPIGSVYMSADKSKTKADFPFMQYGTWEEVPANLCLQTGIASEAGTQRSAGLPNITGQVWNFTYASIEAARQEYDTENGAFKRTDKREGVGYGSSGITGNDGFMLDASLSNPIYGSSDTVQPPAYIVRAWVRTA